MSQCIITDHKGALNQRHAERTGKSPIQARIDIDRRATRRSRKASNAGLSRVFLTQLSLELLCSMLEANICLMIARDGSLALGIKSIPDVIGNHLIKIITTQERVASSSDDLDDIIAYVKNRHIKGPTTEIIDNNPLCLVLIIAVGHRSRSRLIDDPQTLEVGYLCCVSRCLSLCIVEVSGHRNHGRVHRFTRCGLRQLDHVNEHMSTNLLRCVFLALNAKSRVAALTLKDAPPDLRAYPLSLWVFIPPSNKALRARDGGVGRVGQLLSRNVTHNRLAAVAKCNH